jgi:hypothetical protein
MCSSSLENDELLKLSDAVWQTNNTRARSSRGPVRRIRRAGWPASHAEVLQQSPSTVLTERARASAGRAVTLELGHAWQQGDRARRATRRPGRPRAADGLSRANRAAAAQTTAPLSCCPLACALSAASGAQGSSPERPAPGRRLLRLRAFISGATRSVEKACCASSA